MWEGPLGTILFCHIESDTKRLDKQQHVRSLQVLARNIIMELEYAFSVCNIENNQRNLTKFIIDVHKN